MAKALALKYPEAVSTATDTLDDDMYLLRPFMTQWIPLVRQVAEARRLRPASDTEAMHNWSYSGGGGGGFSILAAAADSGKKRRRLYLKEKQSIKSKRPMEENKIYSTIQESAKAREWLCGGTYMKKLMFYRGLCSFPMQPAAVRFRFRRL